VGAVLSSPEIESSSHLLADWLELVALFSKEGRVFVEELTSQLDLDRDQSSDEISVEDDQLEDTANRVASEIEHRAKVLGEAYPFNFASDGRLLEVARPYAWRAGKLTYVFSLIMAHASRSPIVPESLAPTEEELVAARDLFQICATIAAAGHCRGPAFSLGWPRPDSSKFLDKVKEIWTYFRDGKPLDEPGPNSPKKVKDEGIDVVAWAFQADSQPGTHYLLGQVASGKNWEEKSVKSSIDVFHGEWFEIQPATLATPAIFIPYLIEDAQMRRVTLSHGHVLHRGRMPLLASIGVELAQSGVGPIERLDELNKIQSWMDTYLRRVMLLIDL
jgi:hypothetical protein